MKRKLRNLKRLEYNLADNEDDNKPERVEDVESTLVARLKKMEDTFDEIEYTRAVIDDNIPQEWTLEEQTDWEVCDSYDSNYDGFFNNLSKWNMNGKVHFFFSRTMKSFDLSTSSFV